jgi:TolA-binding protein
MRAEDLPRVVARGLGDGPGYYRKAAIRRRLLEPAPRQPSPWVVAGATAAAAMVLLFAFGVARVLAQDPIVGEASEMVVSWIGHLGKPVPSDRESAAPAVSPVDPHEDVAAEPIDSEAPTRGGAPQASSGSIGASEWAPSISPDLAVEPGVMPEAMPMVEGWMWEVQTAPSNSRAKSKSIRRRTTRVTGPRLDAADGPADWKALAAAGSHREAMEAIGDQFDSLVTKASASDLRRLADVARFSGNASRAEIALYALRQRFPEHREAAIASYILGRVAFDQRHAYRSAIRHFETYLSEAKQGALATEARGRIMEARARLGDKAGAMAAARDYLVRHPGGSHRKLARTLAEGGAIE